MKKKKEFNNETALHRAASVGAVKRAKFLLEARLDQKNNHGETPRDCASCYNVFRILDALDRMQLLNDEGRDAVRTREQAR
jgi:hypothetical protein